MEKSSVYIRAGRPCWYVSYFCIRRLRRVHESTGFRLDNPLSEKRAREMAAKRDAAAAKAFGGNERAWQVWVMPWLEEKFARSPRTLERYKTAFAWILLFCQQRKINAPAAVGYAEVMAFFRWRQSADCGRAVTRNTALVELRVWGAILTEAMRRGWIDRNPADRLGLRRDPVKRKPEISDGEIAVIRRGLAQWEGELDLPLRWMSNAFEVAIHQGCRLSETAVPLRDIDLDAGTITFTAKGSRGQKNIFTTRLHPGLRGLVGALREAKAETICTIPKGASRIWWKFWREHKLGHLCFHCTRVTVITRLARAGVPEQQARRFVGHASAEVHRIYQRLRADDLDPCLEALAGVSSTLPKG